MTKVRSLSSGKRVWASWILGSVFGLFLIGVYVFQGSEVTAEQHRLLGLFGGITAGAFSFLLAGDIGLKLNFKPQAWLSLTLKASGGIAVMVFVLCWWNSPNAPIIRQDTRVRVEVRNFVSQIEEALQVFQAKLEEREGGRGDEKAVVHAETSALLTATQEAKEKMQEFLHHEALSDQERKLVFISIERLNKQINSLRENIDDLGNQSQRGTTNQSSAAMVAPMASTRVEVANVRDPTNLAQSLANGISLIVSQHAYFASDYVFPNVTKIHFTAMNSQIANRIKAELEAFNASNVVVIGNDYQPTLAGKILYTVGGQTPLNADDAAAKTNRDTSVERAGAESIRDVIRSIDKSLGDKMEISARSLPPGMVLVPTGQPLSVDVYLP